MSARLGWFVGVSLFVAAAASAVAGYWLVAAGLLLGVAYLMGRADRRRDRSAVAADLAVAEARIAALEDEITYRYDARVDSRWADDNRLMPDNSGGYYSPAALNDRNTTNTVASERGVAAPERAAPLP